MRDTISVQNDQTPRVDQHPKYANCSVPYKMKHVRDAAQGNSLHKSAYSLSECSRVCARQDKMPIKILSEGVIWWQQTATT
eukprot:366909-Amphidinium_carterae.1